eukprot:gene8371-11326_t
MEVELKEASSLITAAMYQTPCYIEIFRNESTRLQSMEILFQINLYLINQKCAESLIFYHESHLDKDSKYLVCFFMLVPCEMSHFSLWEKVCGGLLTLPFRIGFDVTQRLLAAADFYEKIEKDLMKGRGNYLTLQRMVVHPSFQGRGIGSKYLSLGLKKADNLGLPVILSTQEQRNVEFYRKLGFVLIWSAEYVPTDGSQEFKYMNFFLIREPLPKIE